MVRLIIKSYIRDRARRAGTLAVAVGILFLVAGLYGYERAMRNMSYALFLILFAGGAIALGEFFLYYRKCVKLMEAVENAAQPQEGLQGDGSLPEGLWLELVRAKEREQRRLVTEYDQKKKDMADYYTMWIHQIKTPIAAMRLLLEEDTQMPPGRTEREREIKRQAGEELFKIEQYAEMALGYARLDSLSSDLLLKRQEVSRIVKQAVKKYGILFIGSGLSFSMEEFSCPVVTDEKWLCLVLEQVLSNALKYTRQGRISIYGADERGQRQTGRVSCVVIEDTGIGIRAEDLPRIFERGFTGYNGRMDKRSTGIGLYLCRQIMDRLGHTIRAWSREGEGTRMILGFSQDDFEVM